VGKRSQCRDSSSTNHSFLEVHAIVDESDVAGGVFRFGAFQSQEVKDLSLNLSLHAVLNVLRQDKESLLSCRGANLNDCVDY